MLIFILIVTFFYSSWIIGSYGPPERKIVNYYDWGVRYATSGSLSSALENFNDFSKYERYLLIYKDYPHIRNHVHHYAGETLDMIAMLKSGDLDAVQISEPDFDREKLAIGYMLTWKRSRIFLNCFPNDTFLISYLYKDRGYEWDSCGLELFDAIPTTEYSYSTIKYVSPGSFESLVEAIIDDEYFYGEMGTFQYEYSFDYFSIDYGENNAKGWWGWTAENNNSPPWSTFRDEILEIMEESIMNGEEIDHERYYTELEAAEAEYGLKSLSGSIWSRYLLGPYENL